MESYAWLEVSHLKTGEKAFLVVGNRESLVGRTSPDDPPDKLGVGFDPTLSRAHFTIRMESEQLYVRRCPDAKRPLFFEGVASDEFCLISGQGFSSGSTMFRFVADSQRGKAQTLDPTVLSVAQEQDASRGLRAMLALQSMLAQAQGDDESLLVQVLPLLGEIVPTASAFMALEVGSDGSIRTLATHGTFQAAPSRTLLREAAGTGKSVCHLWDPQEQQEAGGAGPTLIEGVNWALAACILQGDPAFVLYVLGSEVDSPDPSKLSVSQLDRAVLAMLTGVLGAQLDRLRLARRQAESQLRQLQLIPELAAASANLSEFAGRLGQALSDLFQLDSYWIAVREGNAFRVLAGQAHPVGHSVTDLAELGRTELAADFSYGSRVLGGWSGHSQLPADAGRVALARALAAPTALALQCLALQSAGRA